VFQGLLPDAARWALAPREATVDQLLPGEEAAVASASPTRAREFAAGRVAARAALAALGVAPVAIPAGPDRRPHWPEGIAGSITHCNGLVAAAAARTTDLAALGIDAEPARPLGADVRDLVATAAEASALDDPLATTVVFSAKESFYKCWASAGGELLEFDDVTVEVGTGGASRSGWFVARPNAGGEWTGRWAVRGGFVVTAAWRPPG
jgi:4'-phosphopantetheinyl transferase EntD